MGDPKSALRTHFKTIVLRGFTCTPYARHAAVTSVNAEAHKITVRLKTCARNCIHKYK